LNCICWSAGHDPARIPQIQDPPTKAVQRANPVVLAYIRFVDCIAAWMSEVIILPIPMIIARRPARSGVDDDLLTLSPPSVVES
jgi:hypothetical protein